MRHENPRAAAKVTESFSPAEISSRCLSAAHRSHGGVATLILLAPLFLLFEFGQLVIAERYVGIKQIERNADPRALGMRESTAFFWTAAIVLYWFWMIVLLLTPLARMQAIGLLAISALGFSMRRNTGLQWTLVILTFEGALRIGMLLSLLAMTWQRL